MQIVSEWILFVTFLRIIATGALDEKGVDGKSLPKAVIFHFPEYAYKETSKNEIIFHELEVACNHKCAAELDDEAKIACIRSCISPTCYNDIYVFDEWEIGEIDVRLNSFKGCVIQRESTHRL